VSASWLQFILALVVMYLLVTAAGYWGKQKRAQQRAQGQHRHDHWHRSGR